MVWFTALHLVMLICIYVVFGLKAIIF